jgi:hypothetical protein
VDRRFSRHGFWKGRGGGGAWLSRGKGLVVVPVKAKSSIKCIGHLSGIIEGAILRMTRRAGIRFQFQQRRDSL